MEAMLSADTQPWREQKRVFRADHAPMYARALRLNPLSGEKVPAGDHVCLAINTDPTPMWPKGGRPLRCAASASGYTQETAHSNLMVLWANIMRTNSARAAEPAERLGKGKRLPRLSRLEPCDGWETAVANYTGANDLASMMLLGTRLADIDDGEFRIELSDALGDIPAMDLAAQTDGRRKGAVFAPSPGSQVIK
jgi:hypothetical protein